MRIIIAISILLLILGSSGYYVYVRATQAFAGPFVKSVPMLVLYIFLLSSFFIAKIIENYSIGLLSNSLVNIGSVAAGLFMYAFLFVVFFDIIRLANYIIPFYPDFVTADYQKTKIILGIITLISISTIFMFGYVNARTPKIKTLDISINKSKSGLDTLNVVAVSDIHLGTMVNKNKTKRLINAINDLNPDVVLIGGDIIDDNLNVVKHYGLLTQFKEINSKYGVYSCMGNHEYISRAHLDLPYFEENGIHILKDSSVKIDNKFYIVGRDDIEGESVWRKKRKSLDELTKDFDTDLPVFLLDHQPYKLDETANHGIDLQFSGHTHNGQFWPLNYITGLIFEEDWGYLKKKDTHFYISSGYGTAVVPIRVSNDSEIVNIRILNNEKKENVVDLQ